MADADSKIEKIGRIDRSTSATESIDHFEKIAPNREYFDYLMTQKTNREEHLVANINVDEVKKPSPMEEARRTQARVERADNVSLNELLSQAEKAIEKIDSVKRKLAAPNLELGGSVQNVLRSKLTHIDESLKIALSKVGIDYEPPEKPKGLISPIQRFLTMLTHGQHQLEGLTAEVARLQEHKEQLSPASLLAVQLKVGLMSQELEFFSSLLNKTLESTKTLMNVQV